MPAWNSEEFLKSHLTTRRPQEVLPDFPQIQKFLAEASRGSNRRIQEEVAKVDDIRIKAKHADEVTAFQRFQDYGPLEAAPAGKVKEPVLNFQGAIRPAAP